MGNRALYGVGQNATCCPRVEKTAPSLLRQPKAAGIFLARMQKTVVGRQRRTSLG